ncbi:MAG: acyltransferase family protein [Clostridiaceae bacterium]|nr:acyltransferase family protein [Clostridiaceae bacterium]
MLINVVLLFIVGLLLWPRPLAGKLRKIAPFLLVGVLICGLVLYVGMRQSDTLEVKALDQKNTTAVAAEIWIRSVQIDGVDYAPEEIFSEGWISENGYLKWRDYDQPFELKQTITADIPAGADFDIQFDTCKWRGKVQVTRSKLFSFVIDTYTDSGHEDRKTISYLGGRFLDGLRIPGKVMFIGVFTMLVVLAAVFFYRDKGTLIAEGAAHPPREVWLDFLKVISALMVVIIHTIGRGYDGAPLASGEWIGYLFLNTVVRCGVPLFIMISGILLLGREPDKNKVAGNIKKAILWLAVWNIAYVILQQLLWGNEENIITRILNLPVQRGPSGHLWYSYLLVWIYIFHPILCTIYKALSQKQRLYFAAITVALPGLLDFYLKLFHFHGQDFMPSFQLHMTLSYIGMMFIGRMVYEELKTTRAVKYGSLFAVLLGLGVSLLASYYSSFRQGKATDQFLSETRLFIICYSIGILCLFFIYRERLQNIPAAIKNMLRRLSEISVGIYFFHVFVIWTLGNSGISILQVTSNTGVGSALCCAVLYYLLSVAGVAAMTWIPGLQRLVK